MLEKQKQPELGIESEYKHVFANISRSRYNTPAVGTKWNGARSRRVDFYRRRGESSPACVVCVCGMRAACGGPGGLPLGSDTHFHSVAIAAQPVHRLQIRPIVHN